ncbi:hypothetical protein A5673_14870 [Mycobacterium sp. E3198]|nr:hypothetical protein A5673_14870 [Mycobacterium sp. E3198]
MHWTDVVEFERKLSLLPGQRFAVVNGPPDYAPVGFPITDGPEPDSAGAVIGFAACRGDLGLLEAVYAAAREARVAWVTYPKPGRMATDLHRDWLARTVRQYGVEAVTHVSIDEIWSALLLRPAPADFSAADLDDAWPGSSRGG